jgi:hypothetical protein
MGRTANRIAMASAALTIALSPAAGKSIANSSPLVDASPRAAAVSALLSKSGPKIAWPVDSLFSDVDIDIGKLSPKENRARDNLVWLFSNATNEAQVNGVISDYFKARGLNHRSLMLLGDVAGELKSGGTQAVSPGALVLYLVYVNGDSASANLRPVPNSVFLVKSGLEPTYDRYCSQGAGAQPANEGNADQAGKADTSLKAEPPANPNPSPAIATARVSPDNTSVQPKRPALEPQRMQTPPENAAVQPHKPVVKHANAPAGKLTAYLKHKADVKKQAVAHPAKHKSVVQKKAAAVGPANGSTPSRIRNIWDKAGSDLLAWEKNAAKGIGEAGKNLWTGGKNAAKAIGDETRNFWVKEIEIIRDIAYGTIALAALLGLAGGIRALRFWASPSGREIRALKGARKALLIESAGRAKPSLEFRSIARSAFEVAKEKADPREARKSLRSIRAELKKGFMLSDPRMMRFKARIDAAYGIPKR